MPWESQFRITINGHVLKKWYSILVKQSKFYPVTCFEQKVGRWPLDVYHHALFNLDDSLDGFSTPRVGCFAPGKEAGGWMGLGAGMDE